LALLWDLNARPNEITLLKIKHIRLKEKYGEGEVLHEAKTGTGSVLLSSFHMLSSKQLSKEEHMMMHEMGGRGMMMGAPGKMMKHDRKGMGPPDGMMGGGYPG
jgi:hypothetical protein